MATKDSKKKDKKPKSDTSTRKPKQERTPAQIERDRLLISELYLQRKSQTYIADKVGVDQATVSRDLKAIQEAWRNSQLMNMNEAKHRELQRIDIVEREAWDAWEKSKLKRETKQTKAKGTPAQNKGGSSTPESIKEVQTTITSVPENPGDPKFMEVILKCIQKRSEILGIDAPTRQTVFEINEQTPKPILRRVAAGMLPELAYAEFSAGINEDKYGKE